MLIYGRPRTGKSALAQFLVARGVWPRVVVFEMAPEPTHPWADYVGYGCTCNDTEKRARYVTRDVTVAARWIKEGVPRIVVETDIDFWLRSRKHGDVDEARYTWDELCRAVLVKQGYALVCDEAANVTSRDPRDIQRAHMAALHMGGKYGVTLVHASQRPIDVNTRVSDHAVHRFMFALDNRLVAKYLANDLGKEAFAAVELPPFHFIYANTVGALTRYPPIKFTDTHPDRARKSFTREEVL